MNRPVTLTGSLRFDPIDFWIGRNLTNAVVERDCQEGKEINVPIRKKEKYYL